MTVRDRTGRFAPTRPRPPGMSGAAPVSLHDKIVAGQLRAQSFDSYANRDFAGNGVTLCELCGRPCRDHRLTDPVGSCIGVRP